MIEMNGVNMTYEAGNRALRDINIRIEDGEFVSWGAAVPGSRRF